MWENDLVDVGMRPAMTGIEGTNIDQLFERNRSTIGSGWIDKPEHVQWGKVEICSGCRGAQTIPLLLGQFIPLHNNDSVPWCIDCTRGKSSRLQHDLNLLFFDRPPWLEIT